jgi:hypothetical protein
MEPQNHAWDSSISNSHNNFTFLLLNAVIRQLFAQIKVII